MVLINCFQKGSHAKYCMILKPTVYAIWRTNTLKNQFTSMLYGVDIQYIHYGYKNISKRCVPHEMT